MRKGKLSTSSFEVKEGYELLNLLKTTSISFQFGWVGSLPHAYRETEVFIGVGMVLQHVQCQVPLLQVVADAELLK